MGNRGNFPTGMFVVEIIVLALLGVLLAGGFVVLALTGPTAGTMTGYNAGLTMIGVSSTMGVGAGALHLHRRHLEDVTALRGEVDNLRGEVNCLIVMENEHRDQLAARRNGRR